MRMTAVGALIGVVLMFAAAGLLGIRSHALAQPSGFGADLITLSTSVGDRHQQLTVIDPRTRVLSVYHVELATGIVSLKSVRNIHWDLQMVEFNGVNPLPREIRALLETR